MTTKRLQMRLDVTLQQQKWQNSCSVCFPRKSVNLQLSSGDLLLLGHTDDGPISFNNSLPVIFRFMKMTTNHFVKHTHFVPISRDALVTIPEDYIKCSFTRRANGKSVGQHSAVVIVLAMFTGLGQSTTSAHFGGAYG